MSEKSINSRIYLDYNATSPLSNGVLNYLRSGEFLFANPASIHTSGKNSRKSIEEDTRFLFSAFGLNENHYDLVFHSGATEFINTIVRGRASFLARENRKFCFIYFSSDHSAVCAQADYLREFGHEVCEVEVDSQGLFQFDHLIHLIKERSDKSVLVNWTWSNNESGVVFPLELARKIKSETHADVHVDAVQSVGKLHDWQILNSDLECYTFSSHKFGSLKGLGFSFVRKSFSFIPLIVGGGQQSLHRSGTENALGIKTIALALKDILQLGSEQLKLIEKAKAKIENSVLTQFNSRLEIVASKNSTKNINTMFFVVHGVMADQSVMFFDLAGIDVGTGSACSSGIVKPSRVLKAYGYNDRDSRSGIRISLPVYLTSSELELIEQKIISVFSKLLK